MEPVRGKGETNSGTGGSVSGLRYGPFGIAGSGIILIGAAGAPIGNWPVTSELCSSIVLLTSLPTVPGAVPLEISPSFSELEG